MFHVKQGGFPPVRWSSESSRCPSRRPPAIVTRHGEPPGGGGRTGRRGTGPTGPNTGRRTRPLRRAEPESPPPPSLVLPFRDGGMFHVKHKARSRPDTGFRKKKRATRRPPAEKMKRPAP